jgi:hypothetical protein
MFTSRKRCHVASASSSGGPRGRDRASYSPRAAGDEKALAHVERWRIA